MGKNLFRNEADRDSHLLPTRHGSVVVIILNVECEKPRMPGRDDAVYQQFYSRKTGGVSDGDAGIVYFFAPHGNLHTMFFLLLMPKGDHQFCICDLAIRWDLLRGAKVKCIGAHRHAQANAFGKVPEFVGKDFDPNGLVGAALKVTLFMHVSSGGVDDRVCLLNKKKLGVIDLGP